MDTENKKFILKVGVIAAAIISVLLIGAGIFLGLFLFIGGKSSLNKMAENYEVYDAEIYAKRFGDKIIKELVLNYGKDINQTGEEDIGGLYQAIKHNNIKAVKFFIENNANVEIAAFDRKTPLIIAVGNSYLETAKILIENGANINNTNGDSWADTPLMTASRLGLDNVVRILLSRNADINAVDMNGNTALHTAALNSQLSVIKLLLEKNPNLDIQNKVGNTALHLAVISGNIDIVGELVLKGANARIRNNDRRYPIDIARANNSAAIFEILREAENKNNE